MKSGLQRVRDAGNRLLSGLRRRFSAARILRARDDLVLLRDGGRHAEWVIARGLSIYITVSCGSVPSKRRSAYLTLAVRKAAPFADPDWYAAWHGDTAMVWIWPRQDVLEADDGGREIGDPELAAMPVKRFMPESLLHGEARADGMELLGCADGVEGRAWRDGLLTASAWWPRMPTQSDWDDFCRGAGAATGPLPTLQQSAWREAPWSTDGRTGIQGGTELLHAYGMPVAIFLVVVLFSYQAAALARLALARHQVKARIEQVSSAVSDVLALRGKAESSRASIRQLLSMHPPASQLDVLAAALPLLQKQHATLVQWAMPNPTTVNVVVHMSSPDPRALVLAFQNSRFFDKVSASIVEGSQDRLLLQASVAGSGTDSTEEGP